MNWKLFQFSKRSGQSRQVLQDSYWNSRDYFLKPEEKMYFSAGSTPHYLLTNVPEQVVRDITHHGGARFAPRKIASNVDPGGFSWAYD